MTHSVKTTAVSVTVSVHSEGREKAKGKRTDSGGEVHEFNSHPRMPLVVTSPVQRGGNKRIPSVSPGLIGELQVRSVRGDCLKKKKDGGLPTSEIDL